MIMKKPYKQVLWAINDCCPYNCQYCYLSFDKDHNPIVKDENQNIDTILDFLRDQSIQIVFLAGAEPLLNNQIIEIIKKLKSFNKKVVLCTNGIISNDNLWDKLLVLDIDAISFSLDSYKKEYNDYVRVKNSWQIVTDNILNIKSKIKQKNLKTKIGVYSVITKMNLQDLYETYKFCSNDLCVDYYIYQPITLPPLHPLHKKLVIDRNNIADLKNQITQINNSELNVYIPNNNYNNLMYKGLRKNKLKKCFINNNFIFIMPDGLYSQCPCFKAKREIRNLKHINNKDFEHLIDCDCFSEECSNIYQLLNFMEILNER